MSDKRNLDPGFWSRADSFVNLANEHSKHATVGEVRASLLFAASRFNTFSVASQAANAEALKAGTAHAIEYFTEEFRKMLEDNFRDQVQNFEAYFARTKGNA